MTVPAGRERTSNPPGLDAEPTGGSAKRTRGTTNGNARGSNVQRRRRREWLLKTYASDVKLTRYEWTDGEVTYEHRTGLSGPIFALTAVTAVEVPTARCYRCGRLLHDGTITVDRIIPGCHGGTYRRTNIRPACGGCNSETGGSTRSKSRTGGRQRQE